MLEKLRQMWSPSTGTNSQSTRAPIQTQRARPQRKSTQSQSQLTKPMMQETWTKKQRIRLAVENKILASRASQFAFYEPRLPTETYVTGWIKTSDGYKYMLKVLLGHKFPDQMPRLLLISPHEVPKYGGGLINNAGLSHKFHTRGKGPNGCVEICHCEKSLWDPSRTITSVLIKGVVWCEAHRRHLKTGESIAHFCDELRDQVPDDLNHC